MKTRILQNIALITFCLFLSCEGKFDESADNYILLTAPIGTCEGRDDDSNSDNIIANFSWENNGSFDNGFLIITETSSGEEIIKKEIETSMQNSEIILERGLEFQWYIKSKLMGNNDSIISKTKENFVSEFITNERTPFPVIIEIQTQLPDSFVVEWANHPDETNNDLTYVVYFSTRIEKEEAIAYPDIQFTQPGTTYASGDNLRRVQDKTGLKAGDYFFKIDVIAQSGNDQLISSTYVRFNLLTDY